MTDSSSSDVATLARSFAPVIGPGARLLILGSMPGQQSLRQHAYYAHPRNAFWPIMGQLFGFAPTLPYDARLAALRAHGIALWDVLHSCERPGSLDASIVPASIVCNDVAGLLAQHPGITRIALNGAAAYQLFLRHARPAFGAQPLPTLLRLPSTSPAHASLSLADKLAIWRAALA